MRLPTVFWIAFLQPRYWPSEPDNQTQMFALPNPVSRRHSFLFPSLIQFCGDFCKIVGPGWHRLSAYPLGLSIYMDVVITTGLRCVRFRHWYLSLPPSHIRLFRLYYWLLSFIFPFHAILVPNEAPCISTWIRMCNLWWPDLPGMMNSMRYVFEADTFLRADFIYLLYSSSNIVNFFSFANVWMNLTVEQSYTQTITCSAIVWYEMFNNSPPPLRSYSWSFMSRWDRSRYLPEWSGWPTS